MKNLLNTEQIEINFTITEEKIFCEYGKMEYSFDDDCAIVNSLSVYLLRSRVGTRLVNELEKLARVNKLNIITVPVSPTKEAVLFWRSLGFTASSEDDKYWTNKIVRSNKENAWDTQQGVIIMSKQI